MELTAGGKTSAEVKIQRHLPGRCAFTIIICNHHHHHVVPPAQIFLTLSSHFSSPLVGLQGYIPCPHRAAVCMFELAVLLLLGHMWGSIGVHHL